MKSQFPWILAILLLSILQNSTAQKLHIEEDDEAIRLEGLAPKISFHDGVDIKSYLKQSGANMNLQNKENGALLLGTNNSVKVTIDAQGDVGIGTQQPKADLDVIGNELQLRDSEVSSARIFNINTLHSYTEMRGEQADIYFHADGNNICINPFTLQGGKVGIGTTTPNSKLEVQQAFNGTDSDQSGIIVSGNGGSGRMWHDKNSKSFRIQQGAHNDTQLVLDDSGQVSVGTEAFKNALLTVHNATEQALDIGVQSGIQPGYLNVERPIGYGNNYIAKYKDGNQSSLFIEGNSASHTLRVFGSAVTIGGSFVNSDRKLKSNIKSLDSSLDKLMKLDPKSYTLNNDKYAYFNRGDESQIGFVAQDVQKLFPELVKASIISDEDQERFTNEEILSVNYAGLTPVLTKAIQEQQAMILELQNELVLLKAHIVKLENE